MARILIAEDEPILRESLITRLKQHWREAVIVAEDENGIDALSNLNRLKPDVAFLDIQMSGLSGIELVRKSKHRCHIVFVTAFDQYAISAFENGAIDYLLKPVSDNRLIHCIERLRARLSQSPPNIQALLADMAAPKKQFLKHLKIHIGAKLWVVPTNEIIFLQSNGHYIRVVTKDREGLIRLPLKKLLEHLDPEYFWQIHRSTVLNIHFLDFVKHLDGGQMEAVLKPNDVALPISKGFAPQFKATTLY